jgi:hypothetical protein
VELVEIAADVAADLQNLGIGICRSQVLLQDFDEELAALRPFEVAGRNVALVGRLAPVRMQLIAALRAMRELASGEHGGRRMGLRKSGTSLSMCSPLPFASVQRPRP